MTEKEESVNLDINFDSISDINFKNVSFYSVNEPDMGNKNNANYLNLNNGNNGNNNAETNEIIKSKSEKKLDLDSLKMLPYYIEKVSQNIKYIDSIINKQIPVAESKTIVNAVNETGKPNSLPIENDTHHNENIKNTRNISTSISNNNENTNNSSNSNNSAGLGATAGIAINNNFSSIQNIVKKSVEGVTEILNNRKLSFNGNLNSNSNLNSNPSNVISNSSKEVITNNNNNNCNIIDIKNFAIIDERDEDLLQRNIGKENEPVRKKEIKKATKIVKKIIPNQVNANAVASNLNSIETKSNNANTNTQINKTVPGSKINKTTTKKALTISNTLTASTNSNKNYKKVQTMPTNKKNDKKTSGSKIAGNTNTNINTNSNTNINASNTSSTHFKKLSSTVHSSTNHLNIAELTFSHNKHPSSSYATEHNALTSVKSNKYLHTDKTTKSKVMTNKKSLSNLTSGGSFNTNRNDKKTANLCDNCKNSMNPINNSMNNPLQSQSQSQSRTERNSKSKSRFNINASRSSTNVNPSLNCKNSIIVDKNVMSVTTINKLNDIGVGETNLKNFVELFYIFNEINVINKDSKLNIQNLNQTLQNLNNKQTQMDLLRILKTFIEDDVEGNIKTNISLLSNINNDNVNLNHSSNQVEPAVGKNKSKVALIQTKWREHRIKKILYPMMNLDLTYNQLENFSFSNCNKDEVIKMGKLHLYSSLLRSSDKFRNILSLLNQASIMWCEFMRNQTIFSTTENLIKDILLLSDVYSNSQSNCNQISSSEFHSAVSKIITNDIKINTNLREKEDKLTTGQLILNN